MIKPLAVGNQFPDSPPLLEGAEDGAKKPDSNDEVSSPEQPAPTLMLSR